MPARRGGGAPPATPPPAPGPPAFPTTPPPPPPKEMVVMPSGALFGVFPQEAHYIRTRVQGYFSELRFTGEADKAVLDQLVLMELLVWRYSAWVADGVDYDNNPVDQNQVNRHLREASQESRQLRMQLAIDKLTRDKTKDGDTFSAWFAMAKRRAKEFGVHREEQLAKALELMHQLSGFITLHDNCLPDERHEQRCDVEDIWKWITEVMVPEFLQIDEHFRTHQQRFWVRDL